MEGRAHARHPGQDLAGGRAAHPARRVARAVYPDAARGVADIDLPWVVTRCFTLRIRWVPHSGYRRGSPARYLRVFAPGHQVAPAGRKLD